MRKTICSRKINLGEYPAEGDGTKNRCEIEVELYEDQGHVNLSVCGSIWMEDGSDILMGGQCLDHMEKIPGLADDAEFKEAFALWRDYHNNGLHAGTRKQEAALKKAGISEYDACCAYLKEIGLYEDDLAEGESAYGHEDDASYRKSYKYGNAWIVRKLPDEVIDRVKKLCHQEV